MNWPAAPAEGIVRLRSPVGLEVAEGVRRADDGVQRANTRGKSAVVAALVEDESGELDVLAGLEARDDRLCIGHLRHAPRVHE